MKAKKLFDATLAAAATCCAFVLLFCLAMPAYASEERQATNDENEKLIVDVDGLPDVKLGMNKNEIPKAVDGLYDSFEIIEDEMGDFGEVVSFKKGEEEVMSGFLDEGGLYYLDVKIKGARSKDGKLWVGMKLRDALTAFPFTLSIIENDPISLYSPDTMIAFMVESDMFVAEVKKRLDNYDGNNLEMELKPEMALPEATINNLVVTME